MQKLAEDEERVKQLAEKVAKIKDAVLAEDIK
jgi:hypothetical protein